MKRMICTGICLAALLTLSPEALAGSGWLRVNQPDSTAATKVGSRTVSYNAPGRGELSSLPFTETSAYVPFDMFEPITVSSLPSFLLPIYDPNNAKSAYIEVFAITSSPNPVLGDCQATGANLTPVDFKVSDGVTFCLMSHWVV